MCDGKNYGRSDTDIGFTSTSTGCAGDIENDVIDTDQALSIMIC